MSFFPWVTIRELRRQLDRYITEFEFLQDLHQTTCDAHAKLRARYNDLNTSHNLLSAELASLSLQHKHLDAAYGQLTSDYDQFKLQVAKERAARRERARVFPVAKKQGKVRS